LSETLTVLVKEVTSKSGTTDGRAWTRHALVDDSGTLVGSSFKALDAAPGSKVEVTREKQGDFWNITGVKPASADAPVTATPALGTGEYVKGKEAPETRAGIASSVALKAAIDYAAVKPDTNIRETADSFYDWLMAKSAAATPEKPSQGLPGASEQPAGEGQITEIGQLLAVLEKQTPASPDPSWTWADEARRYTKANFEKSSSTELTKAEANQLREYLEERIAAIQAEAGVPF
jgi:hypothetical protein